MIGPTDILHILKLSMYFTPTSRNVQLSARKIGMAPLILILGLGEIDWPALCTGHITPEERAV
jgi:hypothetical protein